MGAYLGGNHVHKVTNFAFFFGCAGTSLLGGLFSSCGARALTAVASRCRGWALRHTGSTSRSTWAQYLWLLGSTA